MPGFTAQGKLLVGLRLASGQPDIMRWTGNAGQADLQLDGTAIERNESYSGSRLPLRRQTTAKGGKFAIKIDESNSANWSLACSGLVTTVAAGAAQTNIALAATVANPAKVGDYLALPAKNVSAVAIKDSTGAPKTLTPDVNYILDPFAGTIEIIDLTTGGPYVMPLKADFTPGQVVVMGGFKVTDPELYCRINGINTDDGTRAIFDIFRVRFPPAQLLKLISDDYLDFEMTGSVLADPTKPTSSVTGPFFSMTTPS